MRHTVKLPRLSEAGDEVLVVEWLVAPGDGVAEGESLFTAETDKIDTEVPAPVAGILVECLVAEGDEIRAGTAIVIIED